VIGRGTKIISGLQKCDSVFCLGPLGNGFTQPEQNTDVIAVAGGCGIAPLYFYCREYRGHVKLIYGARSKDHLLLLEEIKSLSAEHIFVTEDGSLGKKGMATDILNNVLQKKRKMLLIACGPEPMLKKVKNIAIEKNIRCEISVESYMACGIGACLGCSVKAAEGGYKRVCTDGPVFDVKDIEF
jgi:dihydroorotate dehydrogenase electron transfer subunit